MSFSNDKDLTSIVASHWEQLRGMTYDLLDVLVRENLGLKLNFERSQAVGYQFWCMLGAQESWISLIESGKWKGFSCSMDSIEGGNPIDNFKQQMRLADENLLQAIEKVNLSKAYEDGTTPLTNYMKLVEHEAHHQGQLINFIFAFDLPIPESWEAKWSLRRD